MRRAGPHAGDDVTSSLLERIVRAVADEEGCDPFSLPPLYETIDPDALELLFGNSRSDRLEVIFEYAGYEVVVTGRRGVVVSKIEE